MPPCISQLEGGLVQVAIEVEDRAQRSAITSKPIVQLSYQPTLSCNLSTIRATAQTWCAYIYI